MRSSDISLVSSFDLCPSVELYGEINVNKHHNSVGQAILHASLCYALYVLLIIHASCLVKARKVANVPPEGIRVGEDGV